MRIKLEPIKQKFGETNCGPIALKSVLDYFGNELSLKEIEKEVGFIEGKMTFTIRLAIAAKKLGYNAVFHTKNIYPSEEVWQSEYYKKNSKETKESLKVLVEEAKKIGVGVHEGSMDLKKVLSLQNKDNVPIFVLDYNLVSGIAEKGFEGHFVSLVDFNDKTIYVNNSGPKNPGRHQGIPWRTFEGARKSIGTDEDILVISKARKA